MNINLTIYLTVGGDSMWNRLILIKPSFVWSVNNSISTQIIPKQMLQTTLWSIVDRHLLEHAHNINLFSIELISFFFFCKFLNSFTYKTYTEINTNRVKVGTLIQVEKKSCTYTRTYDNCPMINELIVGHYQ